MSDDIIARLRCTYRAASEFPCEACTFCAARAEIERLRAAGDALAEQITKPCRCVEAHDGAINETCAPCAACFDWQEARRG